jgi:chromosome segregation ATPase
MKLKALLPALLGLAAVTAALAQTSPAPKAPASAAQARPAPRKAASAASAARADDSKLLSLSGAAVGSKGAGAKGGPILTREELRACFSQEESIRTRLTALETRRNALNQEKAGLAAEQQALRAERGPVDDLRQQGEAMNARVKAFGARVEAYNQRTADFEAKGSSGAQGDRQRAELKAERDALEKQRFEIEADSTRLRSDSEGAVRAYNAKAGALEARVSDWNGRNDAMNETSKGLETERQAWLDGCADRRYREEDEAAIRRGK